MRHRQENEGVAQGITGTGGSSRVISWVAIEARRWTITKPDAPQAVSAPILVAADRRWPRCSWAENLD